jgi:signal transduction histidine kinase
MTHFDRETSVLTTGHLESLRAGWDRLHTWDKTHGVWSDVLVAVVVLLFCLAFPEGFGAHRPVDALLQLALVVPLVWRRRAPMAVFLVVAVVALTQWLVGVPAPGDAALLVALFTVAVHDVPARALTAAGVLEVGVVMASVRWAPAGDVARSIVFLSGMVVAALFAGFTLRTWRDHLDAVVERATRLEAERDQQAQLAAAAERARIAREMHDVVAHNISIMVTLADGAHAVALSNPARAGEAMAEVSATGRMALTDMRHMLGVLRADATGAGRAPQPDLSGLPGLLDRVRGTGLEVELEERGKRFDVPPGVGLTVYRIIQESLTNVLKHAEEPSAAHVELAFRSPYIDLSVRDDGRWRNGVPVELGLDEGHGLSGMRERAAVYGGELHAGPGGEGGWQVTSRIRVDGAAAAR